MVAVNVSVPAGPSGFKSFVDTSPDTGVSINVSLISLIAVIQLARIVTSTVVVHKLASITFTV